MSNKNKYIAVLVASITAGFVGAWTVQPSTKSWCAFAVGSLSNCNVYYSGVDKDKTLAEQIQRGLIVGTTTSAILYGSLKIMSKSET
ncbi:MAG: hypothetical protein KME29_15780 [Calothrix sp. FI2-JRJ7]|jgi:hypothetical protein|nr:hypothetical protein [Calothrix sp. FI2-JRJ7]